MPTYSDAITALRNADAAGDVEGAQRLAVLADSLKPSMFDKAVGAVKDAADFASGAVQQTIEDLSPTKSVMDGAVTQPTSPLVQGAGPMTVDHYTKLVAAAKQAPLDTKLDPAEADDRVTAKILQKRVADAAQIATGAPETADQYGNMVGDGKVTQSMTATPIPDTSPTLGQKILIGSGEPNAASRVWGDWESGLVGSTGATLSYLGRKTGSTDISQLAQSMNDYAERGRPENPNVGDSLVSGIASVSSFFIPGVGIESGTTALATMAPRLAALSQVAGTGVMTALGAAAAADSSYKEQIARGLDPALASRKADEVFWLNAGLMGVTNKVALFSQFKSSAAQIGTAAASFGIQNAGMTQIGNEAAGRDRFEGVPQSVLEGLVLGPVLHGVHSLLKPGVGEQLNSEIDNARFDTDAAARAALNPDYAQLHTDARVPTAEEIMASGSLDDALNKFNQATAAAPIVAPAADTSVADALTAIRPLPTPRTPDIQQQWQDSPEKAITQPGWGILTGTREAVGSHDHPDNLAANNALEQELKDRGINYDKLPNGSYLGNEQGASFRVYADEPTINDIAGRYQQDASLTNRGFVTPAGEVTMHADHANNLFGVDALKADGYTTDAQGRNFSMGLTSPEQIQARKEIGNALRNNREVKLDADGLPTFDGQPFVPKTVDDLPAHDDKNRIGVSREQAAAITESMDLVGLKPVFFSHPTYADGFYSPRDPSQIYVNVLGSRAVDVTAHHEVFHALPEEAQDAVIRVVEDNLAEGGMAEAAKQHGMDLVKDRIPLLHEMAADILGNAQRLPAFIDQVKNHLIVEHGTVRAKAIMQNMVDALSRVMGKLRELISGPGFESEAKRNIAEVYVKNLTAVHDELAKVIAKQLGDTVLQKELAKATLNVKSLDQIEVNVKTVNVKNGKTITTKEKADVALKEVDDQITLVERLISCLGI